MIYLVGNTFWKTCPLWWVLLTWLGQHVASLPDRTDSRQIQSLSDDYGHNYDSKQIQDVSPPNSDLKDLHRLKLKTGIISENHEGSFESNKGNYDKSGALDDGLKSYTFEKFQESKYPSRKTQFEPNKRSRDTVMMRPLQAQENVDSYNNQIHKSPKNTNTLVPAIGSNRNDDEVIKQLIGTGRNNFENNKLKNAILTRFTSYNITKLRDDKRNEEFLLEKRDNTSSDIRYLDSRNRPTNYSDIHRSSLKTIIEPNDLYQIPQHTFPPKVIPESNSKNKLQGHSETNEPKPYIGANVPTKTFHPKLNSLSDDRTKTDPLNYKSKTSTTVHSTTTGYNRKSPWNVPKGGANHPTIDEATPTNQNTDKTHDKVDFVGGQFVRHGGQIVPSGFTQAYNTSPSNRVGNTLEESQNNKSQSALGTRHDFVNGQFTDFKESKGHPGFSPTIIGGGKSDFVGGQFVDYSKYEKVTNPEITTVGSTFSSVEAQHINETKKKNKEIIDNENNQRRVKFKGQKEDEISESSNQAAELPEVTTSLNFDVLGLTTFSDDSSYINESKDQLDIEQTTNKPLSKPVVDDQLKEKNDYSASEKDYRTTTNQNNQKGILEKKQSNLGKQSKTQDDYEGIFNPISVLGNPQTKDNTNNEEPNHKYEDPSILKGDKGNFDHINVIKKHKIVNPILIPYSRVRIPLRAISNPKIQTRPLNVIPIHKRIYMPYVKPKYSELSKPFTQSPNEGDDVVYKTNDGDTEVVVSVSNSPDDKLQNKFPISETNSTKDPQSNVVDDHNQFPERKGSNTSKKSKKPILDSETKREDSDYDEYIENSEALGSSNLNNEDSILENVPNSDKYFTKLLAKPLEAEHLTQPSNLRDKARSEDAGEGTEGELYIDRIAGDSSDLPPNRWVSLNATSSSLTNDVQNDYSQEDGEPDLTTQNPFYSKVTEDVELYAGNPLNIKDTSLTDIDSDSQSFDNLEPSITESRVNGKKSGNHLGELCIPLTKEKYVSLLDLLSGPFYFDKNGRKISLALRGDQRKNCTLSSKQCKFFVDLDNISRSNSEDKTMEFFEQDKEISQKSKYEKRDLLKELKLDSVNSHPDPKELTLDSYKTNVLEQIINEKLNLGKQSERLNKPQLKSPDSTTFSTMYNEDQQKNKKFRHSSDEYPNEIDFNSRIVNPSLNENKNSLLLLKPELRTNFQDEYDLENNQMKLISQPDTHRNRPARMIDSGRSNEGGKCGCSENQILKSPLQIPHYKQFVEKRHDILKNIVHTVGDWAMNS